MRESPPFGVGGFFVAQTVEVFMTQPQVEAQEPAVELLEGEGSASFAPPGTETPTDIPAVPADSPPTEPPAPVVEAPFDYPTELQPTPAPQPGIGDADQRELIALREQRQEFEQGRRQLQQDQELRELEQGYIQQDNLDETTARYVAAKVRAE